jgi:hypothetical protein
MFLILMWLMIGIMAAILLKEIAVTLFLALSRTMFSLFTY